MSAILKPAVYKLQNQVQHYAWGAEGKKAYIPALLGISPEPGTPYAELWIGAHPKGPSTVIIESGKKYSLDSLIKDFPEEILGKTVSEKFNGKLPFLLKVLSCRKALSIQAHPDKELAAKLHKKDPANYPDSNHKPEVSIAIDELKAVIGFRPVKEIEDVMHKYPELKSLTGGEFSFRYGNIDEEREAVKKLYSRIMNSDEQSLADIIERIKNRIIGNGISGDREKFFIEQYNNFGADTGLISLLLFNLAKLKKNEAFYIPAGVPHAYIEGNIIECMANSDNVVRAGLTPKYKDIKTLTEMLTYECEAPGIMSKKDNEDCICFKAPTGEFELSKYDTTEGKILEFGAEHSVYAGIVLEGSTAFEWEKGNKTIEFHKGESFLVPAVLGEFNVKTQAGAEVVITGVPE